MAWMIGIVSAIAIGIFARAVGLDRDRAFYPTVMMVIALLYVLFALIGASTDALLHEAPYSAAFIALAAVGFRKSLWLVAVALAVHGIFDLTHRALVDNPGVPAWWPGFCSGYDLVAAAFLAWLLISKRLGVADRP